VAGQLVQMPPQVWGGAPLGPAPAGWDPGTPGPRDPGSGIRRDPPPEVRETTTGLPRPRGRARQGLFYINPSRRGPVACPRAPGSQAQPAGVLAPTLPRKA